MGANPDQLTADIAASRDRMSETVDEVKTRVSPSQAIQRRADSARQAVSESGTAVAERTRDMTDEAMGRGRHMMQMATDTAREKPLLTGIAAFGAGLLVGALAPSSETERRAARRLQHDLQEPMREAISESTHAVGETVRERASEAADTVRDEARGAMDEVRDDARDTAESARDRAQEAGERVRDEIQDEGQQRPF